MTIRGIVPAIILVILCAAVASGQVVGPTPVYCAANNPTPPPVRVEGYAELTADIVLTCTGGTPPADSGSGAAATATSSNAIPQMTVVVYYGIPLTNTPVASRGLGAGGLSEAVLLVDEPGSGGSSYGANLPISVCPTPTAAAWASAASPGCQEWVGNIGANSNVPVLSTSGNTNTTPGYNAFPGVVSGNTVTFNGVPMLPPASGNTRVFRITNVRLNSSVIGPITPPSTVTIDAAVVISGVAVDTPASNLAIPVAVVSSQLSTTLQNSSDGAALTPPVFSRSAGAGSPGAPTVVSYLRFGESVPNSFRTRVNYVSGSSGSGQLATAIQNVPGMIFTGESGFTPYVGTTPQYFGGNTTYIPGLSDTGTRVKAVFSIPAGATIYAGTSSGGITTSGLSVSMVSSPTAPESAAPVTPTVTVGGVGFVPLVPSGGTATATWEVITPATNPNLTPEVFDIPVAVYAAPGAASTGTVTVTMSYAPTLSDVQSDPIPEFAGGSAPVPLLTFGGTPGTPAPSSLILVLCALGALGLFAARRKLAARQGNRAS